MQEVELKRREKYEMQTSELYAGLGAFVAEFEQVVHSLREALVITLSRYGTPQALLQPAFAELTAAPLAMTFQATMARAIQLSSLDDSEKKLGCDILTSVGRQLKTLTEIRNEIVHGTWFIGWASEEQEDFSIAEGYKLKNTKTGMVHNDICRTKEEFDSLVDRCKEIRDLVNRINGVLMIPRPFSKNFIFVGKEASLEESFWTFEHRMPKSDN
jgi:hypothetical protein